MDFWNSKEGQFSGLEITIILVFIALIAYKIFN
jgi:hypothetical protein